MGIFENHFIIENLSKVINAGLISFVAAFLFTPIAGKIAKFIGAIDLPSNLRSRNDSTADRRIHTSATPKLGGLAVFVGMFIGLAVSNSFGGMGKGILLGFIAIAVLGFLDDKFELSGTQQFIGQILVALLVIFSGISVTSLHIFGLEVNFNLFSRIFEFGPLFNIGPYFYNFIFPADLITLLWIVGIINVVNWVGGLDGLNISISALASTTMLLFALSSNNIPLAIIIGIHVGALLGVFPYNYNPAKIFPGSTGDFINGYLLAIFAILGGTRWTTTFILLGLPILDAVLVVYMRAKSHKEIFKNPIKLLSISDKNHLHHRLLAVGYTKKVVLFIEISMMLALCLIALLIGGVRFDVVAGLIALGFIFVSFTIISYLKQRRERELRLSLRQAQEARMKKPVVNVIMGGKPEEEGKDYERFVY